MKNMKALRVSPSVLVGGYLAHPKGPGALIVVGDQMAHLDRQQVERIIEYLQACIETGERPETAT
jgi:hypothetical protein